jgi:hypothetical protein
MTVFLLPLVLWTAQTAGSEPDPGGEAFFGFTDSSGELVILHDTGSVQVPSTLFAVSPEGDLTEAGLVRVSGGSPENSHRDTEANFDNLPGAVYRLEGGPLPAGTTVLLADRAFLQGREVLAVSDGYREPAGGDIEAAIEEARGLGVRESWVIATVDGGIPVVLVGFEPGDSSSMAGLAAVGDAGTIMRDLEGAAPNDVSVWRVDDGGLLHPEDFRVIAAFSAPAGLEIAFTWAGFEGELGSLLAESGGEFVEVLDGYRYWAPL